MRNLRTWYNHRREVIALEDQPQTTPFADSLDPATSPAIATPAEEETSFLDDNETVDWDPISAADDEMIYI